jgi:chromate reductase
MMTNETSSQSLKVLIFAATSRRCTNSMCLSTTATPNSRQGIPPGAKVLHDRLASSDAFVVTSPEYTASRPGSIKNLIDWVSRFRPQPFDGRHGLLKSASPSLAGGNRGLWALRMPLEHLGSRIFPDMFSLAMAHKAFDGDRIADATLAARFEKNVQAFLSHRVDPVAV